MFSKRIVAVWLIEGGPFDYRCLNEAVYCVNFGHIIIIVMCNGAVDDDDGVLH